MQLYYVGKRQVLFKGLLNGLAFFDRKRSYHLDGNFDAFEPNVLITGHTFGYLSG